MVIRHTTNVFVPVFPFHLPSLPLVTIGHGPQRFQLPTRPPHRQHPPRGRPLPQRGKGSERRESVDGAFLQRSAGQCQIKAGNHGIRDLRVKIADRVREAAEAEGRVFAIMYVFAPPPPCRC